MAWASIELAQAPTYQHVATEKNEESDAERGGGGGWAAALAKLDEQDAESAAAQQLVDPQLLQKELLAKQVMAQQMMLQQLMMQQCAMAQMAMAGCAPVAGPTPGMMPGPGMPGVMQGVHGLGMPGALQGPPNSIGMPAEEPKLSVPPPPPPAVAMPDGVVKTQVSFVKKAGNEQTIFVGGLRKSTEEDQVFSHFSKFGEVESVDIKRTPDGTSRGFAFVRFKDKLGVERALEKPENHMIDNKWVAVRRRDDQSANAGRVASLAKSAEAKQPKPEEPPPQASEDREEEFTSKYLSMAQQLGSMQEQERAEGAASAVAAPVVGVMGHVVMMSPMAAPGLMGASPMMGAPIMAAGGTAAMPGMMPATIGNGSYAAASGAPSIPRFYPYGGR